MKILMHILLLLIILWSETILSSEMKLCRSSAERLFKHMSTSSNDITRLNDNIITNSIERLRTRFNIDLRSILHGPKHIVETKEKLLSSIYFIHNHYEYNALRDYFQTPGNRIPNPSLNEYYLRIIEAVTKTDQVEIFSPLTEVNGDFEKLRRLLAIFYDYFELKDTLTQTINILKNGEDIELASALSYFKEGINRHNLRTSNSNAKVIREKFGDQTSYLFFWNELTKLNAYIKTSEESIIRSGGHENELPQSPHIYRAFLHGQLNLIIRDMLIFTQKELDQNNFNSTAIQKLYNQIHQQFI